MPNTQFSEWLDALGRSSATPADHNTPTDNPSLNPSLMSRRETAELLGVKEQTLACWATTKRYDLPYVKVGRLVKYRREDVERFILENRFSIGVADAQ